MATLKYVGEKTVGGALPLFPVFSAAITACIPAVIADLQAKLLGLATLSVGVGITPPSITGSIAAAAAIVAQLTAALAVSPPAIDISGALSLGFAAKAQLVLDAITKALGIVKQVDGITDAAGVTVFLYEGTLDGLASGSLQAEIQAAIGGSADAPLYIPILVVESSATSTVDALKKALRLS